MTHFCRFTILLMASKRRNHILLRFSCLILVLGPSYSQTDKLLHGQQVKDGMELVSDPGNFKLGFFSLSPSTNRFLGIWYNKEGNDNDPVWIANRNNPIFDKSGSLAIDSRDGNLKIFLNGEDPIVVSSVEGASNYTSATLLESGNLVLHEMNSNGSMGRVLWQSFDYPTDTLLPGMKLGIDLQTGHKWFLQSCSGSNSPAQGLYSIGMDANFTNRLITWRRREVYWTSGLWQHGRFDFSRWWPVNYYNFSFTLNDQEKYFSYSLKVNVKAFPLLRIDPEGELIDERGALLSCPVFGGCVKKETKRPICRRSFVYQFKMGFISGDGFKFKESDNLTLGDCIEKCFYNCSCVAFASTNIYNSTGCEIWSGPINFIQNSSYDPRIIHFVNMKEFEKKRLPWLIIAVVGALVLIMLCSLSYIMRRKYKAREKWWLSLIIALGAALVAPLLCYISYLIWRKLKAKVETIINRRKLLRELGDNVSPATNYGKGNTREKDQGLKQELKIFNFQTIAAATNNFSTANKLGEGGFGPVYKGQLIDGQEIAIKRLSRRSGQGIVEFKNEAKLIAKLQHTNLVRLLGCSLQGEERILVYEYMPNKSLDFFIFNSSRKNLLNWRNRFSIIEGIAQGLVYLHKYSRLRVIHRDLKAGNILLDNQMNPKISDFGMARIFRVNESEANTNRVVGTYGYMSPEYAMNGVVSMKTDVFSFGVLVLEIVSGKKNNSYYDTERPINLAWQLWNEGKGLELVDPELEDGSSSPSEVQRCIHVGLLCVQDQATDRPTMCDVVSMLTNESMLLAVPRQPAFFYQRTTEEPEVAETKPENCSINNVTISVLEAR